ncbi:MAG: creatininase family protein [Gemmatimonadales bacterium]|jgi:creatinine amidohydrolase
MTGRPYVLAETTWKSTRETHYDVAILPWGATEAHNYHLPYGTDNVETEAIAFEAARIAWESGARVIVLPTIPVGVNTQQLDIKLTLNLNPSTQAMVLADLARALSDQGISKLLVLNGHGGNDFRQMIRELQADIEIFICTLNWFTLFSWDEHFEKPGDHAGELETSLMLHLAPRLVLPLSEAGAGAARTFRIEALRDKWAWAPRQWTRVTVDTGVGDPSLAAADKGQRFFADVTAKIAGFLSELAAADTSDLYE